MGCWENSLTFLNISNISCKERKENMPIGINELAYVSSSVWHKVIPTKRKFELLTQDREWSVTFNAECWFFWWELSFSSSVSPDLKIGLIPDHGSRLNLSAKVNWSLLREEKGCAPEWQTTKIGWMVPKCRCARGSPRELYLHMDFWALPLLVLIQ